MSRDLSPFTRLTLLISELKGNKLEDLTDVKKCDLSHHATKLQQEFDNTPHKEAVDQIGEQAKTLLAFIRDGEPERAEQERVAIISSCRKFKDSL